MKILRLFIFLLCCPLSAQTDKIADSILQESISLIYTDIGKGEKQALFLIHNQAHSENTIQALLILADAAYLKGDFAATVKHLFTAQKNSETVRPGYSQTMLELYFARYYRLFGFKELSLHHRKRALKKLQEFARQDTVASALWARYCFETSESAQTNESGISDLLAAQKRISQLKDTPDAALHDQIEIALASGYKRLDDFQAAKNSLEPIVDRDKQNVFTARALLELALIEKETGKPYSGYLFQSHHLLGICTDVQTQKEVCKQLAEYFLNAGKVSEYKKYLEQYKMLESRLTHNTKAARDGVIANLEQAKSKQAQTGTYYFVVAAVLTLLLLYCIYAYRKTRQDYRKFLKAVEQSVAVELPVTRQMAIPLKTEEALLEKLAKFEKSTRFTNASLTINALAKSLDTNTKYLSEVINRNKNANFNQYLNELRINYIIAKMKDDPKYLNYKIYYLAKESGFASQSTFSTVFRASTGISPLSFIKFLKNEKKPS